jgi:hypothetical protein
LFFFKAFKNEEKSGLNRFPSPNVKKKVADENKLPRSVLQYR